MVVEPCRWLVGATCCTCKYDRTHYSYFTQQNVAPKGLGQSVAKMFAELFSSAHAEDDQD